MKKSDKIVMDELIKGIMKTYIIEDEEEFALNQMLSKRSKRELLLFTKSDIDEAEAIAKKHGFELSPDFYEIKERIYKTTKNLPQGLYYK